KDDDRRPVLEHPISSPLTREAWQGISAFPRYCMFNRTSRKCRRMLATRIAATGTRVTTTPDGRSVVRMTARSFLQNNLAIRLSAIGLTFHVSPEMYVTLSTVQSYGAWKRWYMLGVSRNVTYWPSR